MFFLANVQTPDDYGVYTDVGNENLSTPTSLYSFYEDVSGESVQVFTEVPPGVSKFGRAYIPYYVYNSPYMIPPVRRRQNVRLLPRPQIMEHAIDMSTSVDVNPLRGLEDSSLFAEFDRCSLVIAESARECSTRGHFFKQFWGQI